MTAGPVCNLSGARILVTGGSGFMGRSLVPILKARGADVLTPARNEYDLLEQSDVRTMFKVLRPEIVVHLAGLVGGILANRKAPAEYSQQNLLMGTLMAHEAWASGVRRYVTLIGGCSYPRTAPSPIAETSLWEGYPQPESAPYSLAKRMMVVLSQAYRSQYGFDSIVLVPGNVYGPNDNFDLENSHVIPALIRKFDEAAREGRPSVEAWGSGRPTRDFVYVDDACEGIATAIETYSGPEIINISSGQAITIRELVETVAETVGYKGEVAWDPSKPDGQMEKGFDVTRMREWLKVECRTSLREGLRRTFDWYKSRPSEVRLSTVI
jgi:GDP-L-fucose synthase